MPSGAKRFYLCNLIPLWEIDESDMAVDWPRYHAFFGDLVPMKADITNRRIRIQEADGEVLDPDLRIRFEVYESDFLLSGGLNDHMATFSSHSDFGDEPTVRPLRVVEEFAAIPDADRESFIFLRWEAAHDTTLTSTAPDGTTSTRNLSVPDTLEVRCWWRVDEGEGDVSGNPEFYYDVYLEGKLRNDEDVDLHERSDHELEGMSWNVTDRKRKGRITALVDGEYAYLQMLKMMDGAQSSIHILNWKLDPSATLVVEAKPQAEYAEVGGLSPAEFEAMLVRNKPQPLGITTRGGTFFYTASNGNLVGGTTDGASIVAAVQQIDDPTNLDLPVAARLIGPPGSIAVLVLDQIRSRLMLYLVAPKAALRPVSAERGVYAAVLSSTRAFPFMQVRPTLPAVMADPDLIAGMIPLIGDGNPGFADGGLTAVRGPVVAPTGKLNRPSDFVVANGSIYIADTGNHCIRRVAAFDPNAFEAALTSSAFDLRTLAGTTTAGAVDGTGSAARFNAPSALAWDSIGNRLFVADTGNNRIRAVTAAGVVTTPAFINQNGSARVFGEIRGLAFNPGAGPAGTLYIAERDQNKILAADLGTLQVRILTGAPTGEAGHVDGPMVNARYNGPRALQYDADEDTLFIADSENRVIRAIELAGFGTVRTIGSRTVAGPQDIPVTLADVLRRKATEGVKVRALVDGYGAGFGRDDPSPGRSVSVSGAQTVADLRHLHPSILAYVQNHEQTLFDRPLASYHEKMIMVDGREGVAGGIDYDDDKNDGLLHDRRHRTSVFWHDIAAKIEGKAALGLEEAFVRRWNLARKELEAAEQTDLPPGLTEVDRTDATIEDDEIEAVRTFDPTPLVGFLVNLVPDEVKEVLESYRRAILTAEHYVYLEHQYIYYPEIGEFLEKAMRENPKLQVIWGVPFFTEETQDPTQELAQLRLQGQLANSITDASQLLAGNQLRSQVAWHGFFRQREMVDALRALDGNRFGAFSFRRLMRLGPGASSEMIYPHSKLILCDDRFISVGSANANGRGFTKDGELNVSTRSPREARSLRDRLWGEHLGFLGVGIVQSDGSVHLANGHHLRAGDTLRVRVPGSLPTDRIVDVVDPATGLVALQGAPLDPALGRIFWRDPRMDLVGPHEALAFWRLNSHSLADFRKVQGNRGTTNAAGELVVNGHIARVGDSVKFGERLMLLNDEGRSATANPLPRVLIAGALPVTGVTPNTIRLGTLSTEAPENDDLRGKPIGFEGTAEPFRFRITGRSGGVVRLDIIGLMPNLTDLVFDYHVSHLLRQPGGKKWIWTWEIDPPQGIKYAGPGSVIFSPWFILPWIAIDFDPDEQARLDREDQDIRIV